jgi:voltage-gated potassium channel
MKLTRDADGHNYRELEQRLEPVMIFLSIIFMPLLLGPLLANMSTESTRAFELASAILWLAFAVEYTTLLYLAPDRREMVKTHKLNLVIVLLPFLRPLAFLRLTTAASGIQRVMRTLRIIGGRPGIKPYLVLTLASIFSGAGLTLAFEYDQAGSSINSFADALWWAFVTCTTVGYGDHAPVTGGGRMIATALMLIGIAGLGLLTASIAAAFVDEDDDEDFATIKQQLDRIERSVTVTDRQ